MGNGQAAEPAGIDSRVPDEVTRAQALMHRHEAIGLLISTPRQNHTDQFVAMWEGGIAHKETLRELNDAVAADLDDDEDEFDGRQGAPVRELRRDENALPRIESISGG